MAHQWLSDLKGSMDSEDSFWEQMDKELSADFFAQTGLSLSAFRLIPTPGMQFNIVFEDGWSILSACLLKIDIVFPVIIAWRKEQKVFTFKWLILPSEEIKSEMANGSQLELPTDLPFAVETEYVVWPNVHLEFTFSEPPQLSRLNNRFAEILAANEEKGKEEGWIHSAGEIMVSADGAYLTKIDFGSAGLSALVRILSSIAESFPLIKVKFKS